MNNLSRNVLKPARVKALLRKASECRILVVGDVMLDQFTWGRVSRISPEAPVPVVEFERENFMPGGASNVARNLTALGVPATQFGVVGQDAAARQVREILQRDGVDCSGLLRLEDRQTGVKTRIIAHQQQVVRVDRETRGDLHPRQTTRLLNLIRKHLDTADAVIVGDYGKGVVTQSLLDQLRNLCRERALWLSLDPKPIHSLNLQGLSLITPNRREAFELAGLSDETRHENPFLDTQLMQVADRLMDTIQPATLLITLGELGMLLCEHGGLRHHIPTVAREVFDVSGAGDTVIGAFTLAVAAGASPVEAAILSNHAAGVVVGHMGTAVVTPEELLASFQRET